MDTITALGCIGCAQPFTGTGWIDRHSLNSEAARNHHTEPGDYHPGCCPTCPC